MIDAAKVLGEIVGLLGGIGSFLGVFGIALVLLTLLILGFINAVSPASRKVNFFLSVGIVAAMAMMQALKSGSPPDQLVRLVPFFIVMAAPYLTAVFLGALFRRLTRPSDHNRMQRIEALTEELNREIDAMKKWG
ncbi:MAG: hypothetical protein ACWA5T_10445 [Parvularcula sp.]